MDKEQQPQVLALMMKLGCVLIVNSPYDRLSKGYVENLYKTALKRWTSGCNDFTSGGYGSKGLIVSFFLLFYIATSIRASILAVLSAILENVPADQVAPLLEDASLLDLLLESMGSDRDTELIAMAWQTLGILAKSHASTIL